MCDYPRPVLCKTNRQTWYLIMSDERHYEAVFPRDGSLERNRGDCTWLHAGKSFEINDRWTIVTELPEADAERVWTDYVASMLCKGD